jgi:two-component system CheB/CheR fusion protein
MSSDAGNSSLRADKGRGKLCLRDSAAQIPFNGRRTSTLTVLPHEYGKRSAVDIFFCTLAETHRSRSIAIVLSGVDGDGAIGIKRIKEVGGITVAQKPEEAQHDGMPRSAIETGMVDWVLPVAEMPQRLLENLRKSSS